ncbi:tyrosine-type recombinase/integrase [Neptuniibacter sp. QD48_11]|uniref:tyrosine-type recombinase/integrase n=1 Tax=Neptuniibacter sp. QD48_11 TaxID=3398211 RepID=UPI0039F5A85B
MSIEVLEVDSYGHPSEAIAFLNEYGNLSPLPSLLFAKMTEGQGLDLLTKKKYGQIVDSFFQTLHFYGTSFKNVSNQEILGFIQGYYEKRLPFQRQDNKPISPGQMRTVKYVIESLFKTGEEYGFCEIRKRSFFYKEKPGTQINIDEAKKIESNYICIDAFQELLSVVDGKSDFVKERDKLVLRLGYEVGLRSHELVKSNNFSIARLLNQRVSYKLGDVIEWYVVGKGGKGRFVLIQQNLAELIFNFIDKHLEKLRASGHLFCCDYNNKKLSNRHGNNVFRTCANRAINNEFDSLSFHSLRHTYATNLAIWCDRNKVNPRLISDRLGHSDAETTAIYVEVAHVINKNFAASEEMRMVRLDKRKNKSRTNGK